MPPPAHVLIVDDSRIFRGAIEAALAGQEDIAIAGSVFSGEKALEFIKASPPDLVTLDVEMPGIGGLDQPGERSRSSGLRAERALGFHPVPADPGFEFRDKPVPEDDGVEQVVVAPVLVLVVRRV